MRSLRQEYLNGCSFIFSWKVQDFSASVRFIDEYIFSPPFAVPLTNDDSWQLVLFKNAVDKDYLSLYLHRVSTKRKTEDSYALTLCIMDSTGGLRNECRTKQSLRTFHYWGASHYTKWGKLLEKKEDMLPKDTLTIVCAIRLEIYTRLLSVDSLIRTLENLYEKEKRYPSEIKPKNSKNKNKPRSNKQIAFVNSCPIPVLHEWFKRLYSEKLDSDSFNSFEDIIEKVAFMNETHKNGVPKLFLSQSCLPTESTYFTWCIKTFSHLKQEEKFFSPGVCCGSNTWKLLFYLSTDSDGKEIVNIFICPMSIYMNTKKIVKCKICVVNRYGRFPLSVKSVHLYNNNGQWKVPSFLTTEILKNDKKSYLQNDVLILFCSLSVSESRYKHDQSWKVTSTYSKESLSNFQFFYFYKNIRDDMMALLESGLYSDVKLKVGGYEVNAHKSILSERSSEFRHRIKNLNKSCGSGSITIEIADLDKKQLKNLLDYIYGGVCATNFSSSFITTALKYGVDENIVINNFEQPTFSRLSLSIIFDQYCTDKEKGMLN